MRIITRLSKRKLSLKDIEGKMYVGLKQVFIINKDFYQALISKSTK
jgi:hypothetical protein